MMFTRWVWNNKLLILYHTVTCLLFQIYSSVQYTRSNTSHGYTGQYNNLITSYKYIGRYSVPDNTSRSRQSWVRPVDKDLALPSHHMTKTSVSSGDTYRMSNGRIMSFPWPLARSLQATIQAAVRRTCSRQYIWVYQQGHHTESHIKVLGNSFTRYTIKIVIRLDS